MAQISFNDIPETISNNSNENSVDFFNLPNDGDEAIVRIMHDDVSSFNIFTVHENVAVGSNKFRKVNCIRNPKDPVDACPFCKAGKEVRNKIFINMIRYFTGEDGQVVAKPVIWERSLAYATRLKNLIDEYGPLSDCVFKIKRHGAKRSMETTYDILYCNPRNFNEQDCPKIETPFATYSALGTIVMNKSFEDMQQYLVTGTFPSTQDNNSGTYIPKSTNAYAPEVSSPLENTPTSYPAPNQTQSAPITPPWETSSIAQAPGHWPNSQSASTNPGRPSARYY